MGDLLERLNRLVVFEKDDGKGSGKTQEEEPPEGEEDQDEDGDTKPVQMSQKDLNKLFADRAKQAGKSKEKEILDALGIEKLEDAQTLIKSAKDAEEANKTELEKVQGKLTEAETNIQNLQANNASLQRQIAFRDQVAELELAFVNAEAAQDAFDKLDLELVGNDNKGMKKAIEDLQEKRSYLFASGKDEKKPVPPSDGRQKGTTKPGATTADQQNRMRARIGSL